MYLNDKATGLLTYFKKSQLIILLQCIYPTEYLILPSFCFCNVSQSLPAFSFSAIVWSCLDPPMHGGLFARLGLLLHCWGVLAWMESAWMQVLSSSFRVSFTSRWRCNKERPSNWGLTTRTLKWDSDPGGTACMWLSFMTSRCSGLRAWLSLVRMVVSTGRGTLGSMWWARGLDKKRVLEMGRRQRRALDSIRRGGKHLCSSACCFCITHRKRFRQILLHSLDCKQLKWLYCPLTPVQGVTSDARAVLLLGYTAKSVY